MSISKGGRTGVIAGVQGGYAPLDSNLYVPSSYRSDPIYDAFGMPNTAFEFTTSSLTGLTSLSTTPDVANAHTTIPGHLFLKDNDSETVGYYASFSGGKSAIAKITDANLTDNYRYASLFCGVATPGKLVTVGPFFSNNPHVLARTWTGPTDNTPGFPSVVLDPGYNTAANVAVDMPCYLAVVAVSDTDVSYYWSRNGLVWWSILLNHNNSMAIGSIGLSVAGFTSTAQAAFDYLRIWNSVLTIPSFT